MRSSSALVKVSVARASSACTRASCFSLLDHDLAKLIVLALQERELGSPVFADGFSLTRVECGFARQLFPQFLFRGRNRLGKLNARHYDQIARAVLRFEAAPAHAQFASSARPGRNLDVDLSFKCRHRDAGSKHTFPWSEIEIVIKIVSFDAKIRMLGETHAQIKIPGGALPTPGSPWPATRNVWPSRMPAEFLLYACRCVRSLQPPASRAHLFLNPPRAHALLAGTVRRKECTNRTFGTFLQCHQSDRLPRRRPLGIFLAGRAGGRQQSENHRRHCALTQIVVQRNR